MIIIMISIVEWLEICALGFGVLKLNDQEVIVSINRNIRSFIYFFWCGELRAGCRPAQAQRRRGPLVIIFSIMYNTRNACAKALSLSLTNTPFINPG